MARIFAVCARHQLEIWSVWLQEELAGRVEADRQKDALRREKESKDAHDMAVLREQVC